MKNTDPAKRLGLGPADKLIVPQNCPIQTMPARLKWEYIRRHPYYLKCWKPAHRYFDPDTRDRLTQEEQGVGQFAVCLLTLLGAPGPVYNDPANDYTPGRPGLLEENTCAVPATFRDLAVELVDLPEPNRKVLASLLAASYPHPALLVLAIDRLTDEPLDRPAANILSFDPQAPLRGILAQAAIIVQEAKRKAGLAETRRRLKEYEDYLHVWDLREGWRGSGYDGKQELRLRDVAQRLRRSLQTVRAQYKAGFALITGRNYDPITWVCLFGLMKVPRFGSWRKEKPRSQRPKIDQTDRVEDWLARSQRANAYSLEDLFIDVQELTKKGRNANDIASTLEIPVELVDYLKARWEDSL